MSTRKGQELPLNEGILHVVATPIGNLQDLSARAAEVLRDCHTVLCEDTRHTLKLLSALGISKPLERLDQHATEAKIAKVAELIGEGRRMALVSDAGTPGISDPGAELVRACHERGVRVVPVPGPSAVPTLLSASGFAHTGFAFLGFLPRSVSELEARLNELKAFPTVRNWVWFESPHRLAQSLEIFGRLVPASRLVVAKELTKLHEKIYAGDLRTVLSRVSEELAQEGERGEWAIALEIGDEDLTGKTREDAEVERLLVAMLNAGVSASRAAREVSQSFGIPKNRAYQLALALEPAKKEDEE